MHRTVQPEILDSLPHDDPAAAANRRDLRLYNRLMGNYRWMGNILKANGRIQSILEIGAGDGAMALYLLNQHIIREEILYTGVDLIPRPADFPTGWEWTCGDLRSIDFDNKHHTLIANMILHQFQTEELRNLGERISRSGIQRLCICEPARRRMHLWQVQLSRILGVHRITLHDARVSVEAGFRGDEVTHELGLTRDQWKIRWSEHFLGANRLICERR